MEPRKSLIAYALKYEGNWDKIVQAVRAHEILDEVYVKMVDKLPYKAITLLDANYPQCLKHIYKPPIVLFYYGDISLIGDYDRNISIVGSRENSEYGANITREIAGGLAEKGYVIVSGLARGIDGIAHASAIEKGGKTVAILGCGIDICYPSENLELYREIKENHLLISEYPGNTSIQPYYFPIRNRIIAGLSKTLVVTEAFHSSGSLITAALALQGNTDVMCVPHEAGKQSGCNKLISLGAFLVESAEDVIEQMSPF